MAIDIDFEKTLEYLYTGFLLRDLAGKIVPGTVLYLALERAFSSPLQPLAGAADLPVALTVIWIASLWVLGLGVQAVGHKIGLLVYSVKYPPPTEFHINQRTFKNRLKSGQLVPSDAQRYERFEAIREAYGNGAVAALLASLIWLVQQLSLGHEWGYPVLLGGVCGLLVFAVLLLGHHETVRNFDAFWEEAISERKSDSQS